MEQLRNIIINSPIGAYPILKSLGFLPKILESTSFLDDQYTGISWSQRFWHIEHTIFKLQYCKICNKNLAKFSKGKGYTTCSRKCRNIKTNISYKNTCINRFGVDNPAKLPETQEKMKQSCIKRYGTDHISKTEKFKEKLKNDCFKKHGVSCYLQTNHAKEKLLESIGVDNPFKSEKIKEKIKQTNLRLYGNENVAKTEYSKNKFRKIKIGMLNKKLLDSYTVMSVGHEHEIIHNICDKSFVINGNSLLSRLNNNVEICIHCNPIDNFSSHKEIQLQRFIRSICNKEIQISVRSIIPPYELDIYIPELKLAFEFNGNYWHSEANKNKNYHKHKSDLCDQQGIKLIHVWEHDWINKQEIIKSTISGYLGRYKRISAKKCEIIELKAVTCREFINNNHLQGFVGATIYYGLMYNNELVSIISFQKKKDHWEISRFCAKLNLSIIGGIERLWKHFLRNNEVVGKITVYGNRDYFTGKIYERLGFKLEKITEPSFWYIKNGNSNVLSRQQCQKHKLIKQGYDPNKTEHEIMLERGYFRCYNSGNYEFIIL